MNKYIFQAFLLTCLISCGTKTNADTYVKQTVAIMSFTDTDAEYITDNVLIKSVYDKFVFAIDTDDEDNPEDYFTSNALKKLLLDYDFDCENGPCYAYYALRSGEQDSKPDAEDVSQICNIEPISDGWYAVSYLDMGWSGMTRIKLVDGKIDDYERCVSNP